MTLAIDIGNSRTKIAFFEDSVLLETTWYDNDRPCDPENRNHSTGQVRPEACDGSGEPMASQEEPGGLDVLESLVKKYRPERSILANVAEASPTLTAYLEQHTVLHHFPGTLKLPLKNNYRTPDTLGADRLAAACGAAAYGQESDYLVIIAGTCITYNFVSRENGFLGGAISPGLHMRFKAMHTFTGKLPLITLENDYEGFLGKDTRESILSGVQAGSMAEAEKMISSYEQQYPGLRVFLCGGDAEFFDKRLKNSIFADRIVLDRELILKGLDRVLNYQYK